MVKALPGLVEHAEVYAGLHRHPSKGLGGRGLGGWGLGGARGRLGGERWILVVLGEQGGYGC